MKKGKEYRDYLMDIIEAIEGIERFVKGLKLDDFEKDEKTVFAVIRALEIIGEAVKKIPTSVKNENKQIPWRKMTGMRDKLIHEYFGVNIKVVWRTIKKDIPKVKPEIEMMMRNLRLKKK